MRKLRVACIQNSAGKNWQANLEFVGKALAAAAHQGAKLIALPEFFYFRGPSQEMDFLARRVTPQVLEEMCHFARDRKVALLLGSLLEPAPRGKYFNTSVLISEKGRIAARYRKIHLFDVGLKELQIRESERISPGRHPVTGKVFGITCGLSVCYDLRFPELYRKLSRSGAKVLFVPANFTHKTGEAHWEVLLRARAIENQAFVLAPGQAGSNPVTQVKSYGNSMVIDPWGKVLARSSAKKTGILLADLDFSAQAGLRRSFPVLSHRRLL